MPRAFTAKQQSARTRPRRRARHLPGHL